MQNILLIKTTSMGDLIQTCPAITDAVNTIPDLQLTWVVDESFVDIARMHPQVYKIIPLPYRRWKKQFVKSVISGEIPDFLRQLREYTYDKVIDAQSNIKSAVVTLCTKGSKWGVDSQSVREYGAQWAYDHTISVNRKQNHAHRMRLIFAQILGYSLPETPIDYGISSTSLPAVKFEIPNHFIFITTISSSSIRLWPESSWQIVIDHILELGYEIVMPWWSEVEKERVLRLKKNRSRIHLLPPMSLLEKASVLAKAKAAIGIDTGLTHMAAALRIPNIALYGPTDPRFTGAFGPQQVHLAANDPPCAPCVKTRCHYTNKAACMQTIQPQQVIQAFNAFDLKQPNFHNQT